MNQQKLKEQLDQAVEKFNRPQFVENDPILIPHRFSRLQDIEIIGFWTSMLAWGNRKTIINSANRLIDLMDGAPYDFMMNHEEKDRIKFADFKHRTFQYTDTLYFLTFFQDFYAFIYKFVFRLYTFKSLILELHCYIEYLNMLN